jgi:flagellar motor switch protein FliM
VKKFKCYYGVSHGNVAVQVTRQIPNPRTEGGEKNG